MADSYKHRDTGAQIFCKKVLNWEISDILNPQTQQLHRLPQALSVQEDINSYYQNFLPLILEEARAILAQGLDAINKNKTRSFAIKIIDLKIHNIHHPVKLELKGKLPDASDEGTACVVLLLTYHGPANDKFHILCLADIKEENKITAKAMLKFIERNPEAFDNDNWTACVLGSVLTQMRMYEACYDAPKPAFIKEVVTGLLESSPQKTICAFLALNGVQQQAVQKFICLSPSIQQIIKDVCILSDENKRLLSIYISLNELEQQMVQTFLILAYPEQLFISNFYKLSIGGQQIIKDFSKLNLIKRQAICNFFALEPAVREAIKTISVMSALAKDVIKQLSFLGVSEQTFIYSFYRLSAVEKVKWTPSVRQ